MQPQTNLRTKTWQASLSKELYTLFCNLSCGLKILLFRSSAFERVVVSYDQLFLLVLFYALTVFLGSYSLTSNPEFSIWGLGNLGADLLITLLAGYMIAKAAGNHAKLALFMVVSYCIAPVLYIISDILLPKLPTDILVTVYMAAFAWVVAIMFFITYVLLERHRSKAIMITGLWFLISMPMAEMSEGFWYENYVYEDEAEETESEPIDAEKVFYSQFDLLDLALQPINPGVQGIDDLFFVGFGSYASQDVFMKEIGHIQTVADTRLGTHNRSVALINNAKTLNNIPLASATNLDLTLRHLGKLMNIEEDVLFLYLTSHGSKQHELSVEMQPLGLNDITPQDLKKQLDDAGIRWRIILVSACYSGGFIEPLKDENSIILTAAAHDKTSFGCSNKNEYTYFGEALFKDLPAGPYQFINSFEQAITSIQQREEDEGLEPSQPQLYVGTLMKDKLDQLQSDISHYPTERFQ